MGRLSVADIIHRTIVFGAIGFGVSVLTCGPLWPESASDLRLSSALLGGDWLSKVERLPVHGHGLSVLSRRSGGTAIGPRS